MEPRRRQLLLSLVALSLAGAAHANPLERSYPQSYRQLRADYKAHLGEAEWKAFKAQKLEPVSMRERWDGEDREGFVKDGRVRRRVEYLRTAAARAPYQIRIGKDGKLYSGEKLFDTEGRLEAMVMDEADQHYGPLSREDTKEKNLKHSSFLAGEDARMGYEAVVERGVVRRLKNRSGHYRPSRRSFMRWLLHLESQGVDMNQLEIEFDPKSK
jgi:hypothetical protein